MVIRGQAEGTRKVHNMDRQAFPDLGNYPLLGGWWEVTGRILRNYCGILAIVFENQLT